MNPDGLRALVRATRLDAYERGGDFVALVHAETHAIYVTIKIIGGWLLLQSFVAKMPTSGLMAGTLLSLNANFYAAKCILIRDHVYVEHAMPAALASHLAAGDLHQWVNDLAVVACRARSTILEGARDHGQLAKLEGSFLAALAPEAPTPQPSQTSTVIDDDDFWSEDPPF